MMRYLRERQTWEALAALSVAAVLLLLAACSGGSSGDDPAPTTTPATPATPATPTSPMSAAAPIPTADDDITDREDDLRQAATEAVQAYIDGNSVIAYTFQAADYRERCPFGEYLGVIFIAGGDISEAEATVEGIRIEGERAFVDIRVELNGVDLFEDDEEDEYPDYWILEDDEWKSTSDDPAPCQP